MQLMRAEAGLCHPCRSSSAAEGVWFRVTEASIANKVHRDAFRAGNGRGGKTGQEPEKLAERLGASALADAGRGQGGGRP